MSRARSRSRRVGRSEFLSRVLASSFYPLFRSESAGRQRRELVLMKIIVVTYSLRSGLLQTPSSSRTSSSKTWESEDSTLSSVPFSEGRSLRGSSRLLSLRSLASSTSKVRYFFLSLFLPSIQPPDKRGRGADVPPSISFACDV
jgi:hypothetical protein